MNTTSVNRGTLAALFVAAVWGLSFVAASLALQTLSPVLLATVRFIIATIIFSPILIKSILDHEVPERRILLDMA